MEKTFTECLVLLCQRTPCPPISWRKLLRIATKPWNSWRFFPSKVFCYTVPCPKTWDCNVRKTVSIQLIIGWSMQSLSYKERAPPPSHLSSCLSDVMYVTLSLRPCILQAIKNWRWEWPGNETISRPSITVCQGLPKSITYSVILYCTSRGIDIQVAGQHTMSITLLCRATYNVHNLTVQGNIRCS